MMPFHQTTQKSSTTTSWTAPVKDRRMPVLTVIAALLTGATVVLATACDPGADQRGPQEHNVFAQRWYTDTGPATTGDEQDVGIVELDNISKHAVYIRSARFQSVSPAVVTDYVVAYTNRRGEEEVGVGNYLKMPCRQHYKPYPVTKDVIPPHSIGGLYILIGFHIRKPGTYHIRRVRITYVTSHQEYWQDVSIGLTVHVTEGKADPPSC
jgi:hypothetical protein